MADRQVTTRVVLVVEPAGNLWGSERALLDGLQAPVSDRWRIAVCCPPESPVVDRFRERGIDVYPVLEPLLHRRSRWRRLRAAASLFAVAARTGADLIHVNQAGATRLALAAGALARIPVLPHVRLAEDVPYIESLRATPGRLPVIVCVSEFIKSLFRTNDPLYQRLVRLYDPFRLRIGDPIPESGARVDVWRFVCIGRVTPLKGQLELIHALDVLRRRGRPARLAFAGTAQRGDEYIAHIDRLIDEYGIGESVRWLGFLDDVRPLLRSAEALVCPSRDEALGRVVFEAWEAGTVPIVYAGSGGPAEVVQACNGGILYYRRGGEGLADAMEAVVAMSAADRLDMVERGRAWLKSHSDPDSYGFELRRLWDVAISEAPPKVESDTA
jgi:glycosyltransferase involved in cell wall biosynthesis